MLQRFAASWNKAGFSKELACVKSKKKMLGFPTRVSKRTHRCLFKKVKRDNSKTKQKRFTDVNPSLFHVDCVPFYWFWVIPFCMSVNEKENLHRSNQLRILLSSCTTHWLRSGMSNWPCPNISRIWEGSFDHICLLKAP